MIPDRYKKLGFTKLNSPKKTPSASKSNAVVIKDNGKYELIRFGQQGVTGSPKKEGESEASKKRRNSFKARHAKNIAKGKSSAAYWANKVKWEDGGEVTNEFLEFKKGGLTAMQYNKQRGLVSANNKGDFDNITPNEARLILHNKSINGKPLTKDQYKLFGYLAKGNTLKYAEGGSTPCTDANGNVIPCPPRLVQTVPQGYIPMEGVPNTYHNPQQSVSQNTIQGNGTLASNEDWNAYLQTAKGQQWKQNQMIKTQSDDVVYTQPPVIQPSIKSYFATRANENQAFFDTNGQAAGRIMYPIRKSSDINKNGNGIYVDSDIYYQPTNRDGQDIGEGKIIANSDFNNRPDPKKAYPIADFNKYKYPVKPTETAKGYKKGGYINASGKYVHKDGVTTSKPGLWSNVYMKSKKELGGENQCFDDYGNPIECVDNMYTQGSDASRLPYTSLTAPLSNTFNPQVKALPLKSVQDKLPAFNANRSKNINRNQYREPNYTRPLAFNSLISGMFNNYNNNVNSNNILNTAEYNNPYDGKFTQYNKYGGKVYNKMMKSGGFVKYEEGGDVSETREELQNEKQQDIGLRQQQLDVFFNKEEAQIQTQPQEQYNSENTNESTPTTVGSSVPTNYVDNTTGLMFKSSGESGVNNVGVQGKEIGNRVAQALGYTPTFNSVYRTQANQNKQANGVKNSYHLTGNAVDIKPADWEKLSTTDKEGLLKDYTHVFHNNHHHLEPKKKKYEEGGEIGLRQKQLDVLFNEKENNIENPYTEDNTVTNNNTQQRSFGAEMISTQPTTEGDTPGNSKFNVGNIRDSSTGKFKSFNTYEEGRQALIHQLNLYKTGKTRTGVKPTNSLYEAMAKYAPASDKNNPTQYADFIAKRMGISAKTPISEIDLNKWADAITIMEGNTKLRK